MAGKRGRPRVLSESAKMMCFKLSARERAVLKTYAKVKKRSATACLRIFIEGAQHYLEQNGIALINEDELAVAKDPEISSPAQKPAREPEQALSDDGIAAPRVSIAPPAATAAEELDEDGEELSTNAKIMRNRAKPASSGDSAYAASVRND